MNLNDSELSLLEKIYESEHGQSKLTQRDLAEASGLSLGMTNALVRRFAESGWVKLTHLSSKSVRYALTPAGVAEIAQRTAGHFQRAARNADLYRDRIEAFVLEAKAQGAMTLVLAGSSEMDFLLEYVCERHGLTFVKSADRERAVSLGKRPGVILVAADVEELGEVLGKVRDEKLPVVSIPSIIAGLNPRAVAAK
jgi:DNA-binding MarR family transcriptional regulator